MNFRSILAIGFVLSIASVTALAQGPGGGGFNPGGGGGPGGGGSSGGSFTYDSIASDTTNADHTVTRTDGGLLYRLAASPTAVSTPATVTAIADGLFSGCSTLKTADLSASSIAEVPEGCFAGCTALTSVILPATCTAIGPGAFAGCTSLASVTAPSVTTVGTDAFRGCSLLTALPNFASGASIGDYAFSFSGLTSLDASGLSLSPGAFSECTALTSATGTPTNLPDALFSGCGALSFDPSACTSVGQAALAGVPFDTIPLATGVVLSDYAFAADAATVETLLDTAEPTAFDPASLAFLGRTLSYDTGNGIARVEAAALVTWLATESEDEASPVEQPTSYATADLETWLADADNADALVDYTGASLSVSGDTFLFTPPSASATSLSVTLEGTTDLQAEGAWSADTLLLSSTGEDGMETYILAPSEESADSDANISPIRAFARLTFTPAW